MADKKIKVAVVEDDEMIMRAYGDGLRRAGMEVYTAANGQEGLDIIRVELPDIVLLDIIMPDMNGFEVLREMKKDEATASIPVIVLSNLGQSKDIDRAIELGAKRYLVKANTSIEIAIDTINNVLGL